jgi:hypothetical protein
LIQFKAAPADFIHNTPQGARERAWGVRVNYYRLYVLSGTNGRFVGFEEIEADDDVEAVRKAEAFAGNRPLELWCGSRKVRAFPAVKTA